MKSDELAGAIAEKTGIPAYQVRAVITALVQVVKEQTRLNLPVPLPWLGVFKMQKQGAKQVHNVIAQRGVGLGARVTKTFRARKKLVFEVGAAQKWIE